MAKKDKLITVYTGFEVNVQHLQNLFNDADIYSIIKNDSESAVRAGFGVRMPGQARILVYESQKEKAYNIVHKAFPEYAQEEE